MPAMRKWLTCIKLMNMIHIPEKCFNILNILTSKEGKDETELCWVLYLPDLILILTERSYCLHFRGEESQAWNR